MPVAKRVRPKEIFSALEWEILSRRQPWRGPLLVLHAWGLIIAAVYMVAYFPNPLTVILAIMIIGSRQLGLAILMHEAAHGALHPKRQVNDFLGHWLCAAPVGAQLSSYRDYHLKHHKYVQQTEDPDLGLAAAFPVSRASLRRKIVRDLTGQTFLRQRLAGLASLKLHEKPQIDPLANDNAVQSAAERQAEILSSRTAFRDHLMVNAGLLLLCVVVGLWWAFPFLWLVAMATWFQMVTRIRNIAEHACVEDTDDPLAHARTTHARWWERILIAPYWVHFHSEHHAFMHLPCYRLPDAHRLLVEKGYGDRIPQCRSYVEVLTLASSNVTAP